MAMTGLEFDQNQNQINETQDLPRIQVPTEKPLKLNHSSVEYSDDDQGSKDLDKESVSPPLSTQMNEADINQQRSSPNSNKMSNKDLGPKGNVGMSPFPNNSTKYEINYNILKQMLDEGYTWDDTDYPTISLSKNTQSLDDSLAFRAFMNHYRKTYFQKYQKITNPNSRKIHEIIFPDLKTSNNIDINEPITGYKKSLPKVQENSSYFKIDYKGMKTNQQSKDINQNSGMMKISSNFSAATFQVKGMIGRKSSQNFDQTYQIPLIKKDSSPSNRDKDFLQEQTMSLFDASRIQEENSPLPLVLENEFEPIPEIKTPGTPLNIIVLKKDGSEAEQYIQNQAILSMKQIQFNESLNSVNQSYIDQRETQPNQNQYGTNTERTLKLQSGISSKQDTFAQQLMDHQSGLNAFGAESVHHYLSMYPNQFQLNVQPTGSMSESPFRRFQNRNNSKQVTGHLMSTSGKGIMKTKGLLNYKKATNPDLTLHVGGRNSSQMSNLTNVGNQSQAPNDSIHVNESQAIKSQNSQGSNKNYESKSDHELGGNVYQRLINQDLDGAIQSPKYHHTILGGAQLTDGSEHNPREQINSMDKKYTEYASHSLITAALESSLNKEDMSQDKESELKQLKSPKFRPHMLSLQQIKSHADASVSQELNIKKIETDIGQNPNQKSPMTSNVSRQRTPDKHRSKRLDQHDSPSKDSDQTNKADFNTNQNNSGRTSQKIQKVVQVAPAPLRHGSVLNPFQSLNSNLQSNSSKVSNFNVNMITLTNQKASKQISKDDTPKRQHLDQVTQIQIQKREIQKLKDNLDTFRKTGVLFSRKDAQTSDKILIQSHSDFSSQKDLSKNKQITVVTDFPQRQDSLAVKNNYPKDNLKQFLNLKMKQKPVQKPNEIDLSAVKQYAQKEKTSRQRHKDFIDKTLKNFTKNPNNNQKIQTNASKGQSQPKKSISPKNGRNNKQSQKTKNKVDLKSPKRVGTTMTSGLQISALENNQPKNFKSFQHKQHQNSSSFNIQESRLPQSFRNQGVEIGTGVEDLDRQRFEQIMSIQTPVSIDRAFNEIMNNGRSPHISNEPYPLYDEKMKSTDLVSPHISSIKNAPQIQSMNQTGMDRKISLKSLNNSRNQTPTQSAKMPQNQHFLVKKIVNRDFPKSIKSPLFHRQRNSNSVLDGYEKKKVDKERKSFLSGLIVENSNTGPGQYQMTTEEEQLQKTNYIEGFQKHSRTSHEAAVALLSEQAGASTVLNGPSKHNKSSNFGDNNIKKVAVVTDSTFALINQINENDLQETKGEGQMDEGNQINEQTPDIESPYTVGDRSQTINPYHKSIPFQQKEHQLIAEHPLMLGGDNQYPSLGILGNESPAITDPSPVKFARIYNKDIDFQMQINPQKLVHQKQLYKNNIPGLQQFQKNHLNRNTILQNKAPQVNLNLLPALGKKMQVLNTIQDNSVSNELSITEAIHHNNSKDLQLDGVIAAHITMQALEGQSLLKNKNFQNNIFPNQVPNKVFNQQISSFKGKKVRQFQGSVTQVGFYKSNQNQFDSFNQPHPKPSYAQKSFRQRRSTLDNYQAPSKPLTTGLESQVLNIQGSSALPTINETNQMAFGGNQLTLNNLNNHFPKIIIKKRPSVNDLISPHSKTIKNLKKTKNSMSIYKQHSPRQRQFSKIIAPNRWRQSGELSEFDDQPLNSKIM